MSVFVDQTLLTITANTGYSDLASATLTQILWQNPIGDTGEFTATVSGQSLVYQLSDGDIGISGVWKFQAYWEVGGLKGIGKKKRIYFEQPIVTVSYTHLTLPTTPYV